MIRDLDLVIVMDAADFGTFDRAFGRVCGAFRLKVTAAEREELTKTYFKVLEPYGLDDVLEAGKRCLEKFKKFPTIADWITELGGSLGPARLPLDARQMSAGEVDAMLQAERTFFAGAPCACAACVAAGVDGLPLRYVPLELHDGTLERAWHPARQRLEVVGQWVHGEALRAWYATREQFSTAARRHAIARSLVLVAAREPGQEG